MIGMFVRSNQLEGIRTALGTLFGALLLTAVCPQRAEAIVGGELDGDRHPCGGSFVFPDGLDFDFDGVPDWDPNGDGVPDVPASGGNFTLIHPRVAVGAAHVFEVILEDLELGYYTIDELRVSFSSHPIANPKTWLEVTDVLIHPDYDPTFNTGGGATPLADVAVVILKKPVRNIEPAPVAAAGLLDFLEEVGELDGTKFNVVGYGNYGDAPNQILPSDGQRRVAQSEFLTLGDRWLFLDQNAAHGNGGTAVRDSGGPTFWVDPVSGEEILVSLTSRGDWAFVATGITYRVDTDEALGFLDSAIEMVEDGVFR